MGVSAQAEIPQPRGCRHTMFCFHLKVIINLGKGLKVQLLAGNKIDVPKSCFLSDLVKNELTRSRARTSKCLSHSLACTIEVRNPNFLFFPGKLNFFSILDVLWESCECSIESFLSRIIVSPVSTTQGSASELLVFVLGEVGFTGVVKSISWCEAILWVFSTSEGGWNFGLVQQSFVGQFVPQIILWVSLVRVLTEKMPCGCVSKTFFHIVGENSLLSSDYISIGIPGIVIFVVILFPVFKLGVLDFLLFSSGQKCSRMDVHVVFLFQVQLLGSEWVLIGITYVCGTDFGEQLGAHFVLQTLVHLHSFRRFVG